MKHTTQSSSKAIYTEEETQQLSEQSLHFAGFIFTFVAGLVALGIGLGTFILYQVPWIAYVAGLFVFVLLVIGFFNEVILTKVSNFSLKNNSAMNAIQIKNNTNKMKLGCIGLISFPVIGYNFPLLNNMVVILVTISMGLLSHAHLLEIELRGKRLIADYFSDVVMAILTVLFVVSEIDSSISNNLDGYIVLTAFNVSAGFSGSSVLFYLIKKIDKNSKLSNAS